MKCVYCGKDASETRDHVPPKCLLSKPYPDNLLTVPSCEACNAGSGKDEEYFRLIIVGLMCHTAEADLLFDGSISRSMDRNSKIEELMFASLRPAHTDVILEVDYPRIFRIAEKITRGLEFATARVSYPLQQEFSVDFCEVESGSGEDKYGPAFTYRRSGEGSGWEFTFFDSVRFVVQPA